MISGRSLILNSNWSLVDSRTGGRPLIAVSQNEYRRNQCDKKHKPLPLHSWARTRGSRIV